MIPTGARQVPFAGKFASSKFTLQFDGLQYSLKFDWSQKNQCWYMSLFTTDNESLFLNKKCVTNNRIAYAARGDNMPPGYFWAGEVKETNVMPGRDDFGFDKRVGVYYVSA